MKLTRNEFISFLLIFMNTYCETHKSITFEGSHTQHFEDFWHPLFKLTNINWINIYLSSKTAVTIVIPRKLRYGTWYYILHIATLSILYITFFFRGKNCAKTYWLLVWFYFICFLEISCPYDHMKESYEWFADSAPSPQFNGQILIKIWNI